MSVLSDKWIRKMSKEEGMISPFEEKQVRGDSISYGLSSFGYDARVSDEFKIFTNVNSEIVDPKNFKSYAELKAKLHKVLQLDGGSHAPSTTAEDSNVGQEFQPNFKERTAQPAAQAEAPTPTLSTDDGEDDSLDFFKSLAED